MTECKGMNCGATTGPHSRECLAEHAAAIVGGRFVKAGAPSGPWQLVPADPTDEMVYAIATAVHRGDIGADIWAAGFEAAPQPPSVGDVEVLAQLARENLFPTVRLSPDRLGFSWRITPDRQREILNSLAEPIELVDRAALTARDQHIAQLKQAFEESQNEVVSRGKLLAAALARIQQLEAALRHVDKELFR